MLVVLSPIFVADTKITFVYNFVYNSFKNAVRKLGIKECEASSDVNANSRPKDEDDVAIEKYKDHLSIKIINENVLFKSCFSFKEILESDTQK